MAVPIRFEGVLVVMTTPLHENQAVDEAALRALVRHVLAGGVHGIVALGSAGEFAALTDEQKRRVIGITVDEVAGRVPVIVGTGEPGTRPAVQMTRTAADLGADGALVVPPFYYRPTREAIIDYYRAVAAEGGLPILLYNIPGFTKVDLTLDVVQALLDEPNVVGIKDSSGNLQFHRSLCTTCRSERFTVVTGSDGMLFAELVAGNDGCISPGSNLVPGWFVALWDAFHAGDWAEAWRIQERIQALHAGIRAGAFPAAIKGALSCMGMGGITMAAPTAPVTPEELERISGVLACFGLL